MEGLGFERHQSGFYIKRLENVSIYVGNTIAVQDPNDNEIVTLCDYSYERLLKLFEVWKI